MEDNRTYYERRVREELAKSIREQDPALKALHRRWSQMYRDRIDQMLPRVTLVA